ncbi:MAG: hypothetical protein ACFFD4_09565 [Candidatus Odinarchaeota archaeon]
MNYAKKLLLIVILVTISPFSTYLGVSSPEISPFQGIDVDMKYTVHQLWNGTAVEQIHSSGDFFIVKNGYYDLVLLKNSTVESSYLSSTPIYGVAAVKDGLVFNSNDSIQVLWYQDFISPVKVLNDTYMGSSCTRKLVSYQNLVYHSCYEFGGFYVYDFSNLTQPALFNQFFISWHAYDAYVVNHHGFFEGDTGTAIFDLADNRPWEASPVIWQVDKFKGPWFDRNFYFDGLPAISDQFIVFSSEGCFELIPRSETATDVEPVNISYAEGKDYRHCLLILDNILIASGSNNTLTFFKISNKLELVYLSEIFLGKDGKINDILPDEATGEIYIADGVKGLLKLTIDDESIEELERVSNQTDDISPQPAGMEPWFIIPSLILLGYNRRKRGSNKS